MSFAASRTKVCFSIAARVKCGLQGHIMFLQLLSCLADVPLRSSCFSSRSACGRLMMG